MTPRKILPVNGSDLTKEVKVPRWMILLAGIMLPVIFIGATRLVLANQNGVQNNATRHEVVEEWKVNHCDSTEEWKNQTRGDLKEIRDMIKDIHDAVTGHIITDR